MANQQLVDYIKSQLASGVLKPDLEKAVAQAGWSPQDSSDAFAVAEGRAPTAPAPKPTPVVAPAQPEPMRPATMQMNVQGGPEGSRVWLWVVFAIALAAVALVAAYMFIEPVRQIVGFYVGQTPPPTRDEFVSAAPAPTATTTPHATTTSAVPPATTTATTTP